MVVVPRCCCILASFGFALLYQAAPTTAQSPFGLSHTLGDHAVLQNPAVIHGTGTPGATVSTIVSAEGLAVTTLNTTVGEDGVWRQPLPTMVEGFTPHSFNMSSGSSSLSLMDILFGKTLLCSGQVLSLSLSLSLSLVWAACGGVSGCGLSLVAVKHRHHHPSTRVQCHRRARSLRHRLPLCPHHAYGARKPNDPAAGPPSSYRAVDSR